MKTEATSFPVEVQRRLDTHIEAVDRVLAESGVPASDRNAIVGEIELQVRDTLTDRCPRGTVPSIADVDAVLAELDPPESYIDRDALASIAAPASPSTAGRVSLGLTLAGFVLVITMAFTGGIENSLFPRALAEMMALTAIVIFPLAFVCGLIGRRSTSGKLGAGLSGVCCLAELAFFVLITRIPG
jgi:hypothetical protein